MTSEIVENLHGQKLLSAHRSKHPHRSRFQWSHWWFLALARARLPKTCAWLRYCSVVRERHVLAGFDLPRRPQPHYGSSPTVGASTPEPDEWERRQIARVGRVLRRLGELS